LRANDDVSQQIDRELSEIKKYVKKKWQLTLRWIITFKKWLFLLYFNSVNRRKERWKNMFICLAKATNQCVTY
jgi:hypothetical protein